jgi:hypothetical protein
MSIQVSFGSPGDHGPTGALIAGVICVILSAVGFFAAFSGGRLGPGIPFMPDALNQAVGRFAFGLGTVLTAALAMYAFYDAWRLYRRSMDEE